MIDEKDLEVKEEKEIVVKMDKKTLGNFVVNWFFDNNEKIEIPEEFYLQEAEVIAIQKYQLYKMFITYPQLLPLVNKTTNNLFDSTHNEFDEMLFFKSLIRQNGLYQTQLKIDLKFKINKKENFKKQFSRKQFDAVGTNGINSLYSLNHFMGYSETHKTFQKAAEVKVSTDKESLGSMTKLLKILKDDKNKDLYLDKIDQNIIDTNRLSIFDVRKISNKEILFIFIDQNNNKVYYKEPISMKFFISNQTSIINNDYIMPYDPNQFSMYYTNNFAFMNKIRNEIGNNFKLNINLGMK